MTAQDRPFAALTDRDDYCAERKCLRKCKRRNKPDHHHAPDRGECHEGPCWPTTERTTDDDPA